MSWLKRSALMLAALGIAGSGTASGQDNNSKKDDGKIEVGDFAPDFEAKEWVNLPDGEEAPSLAELRGLVVVVFFFAGWHEGGQAVIGLVNEYENNESIGRNGGVYTIGLTNATRAQAEKLARDAKAFFPIGCASEAAKEYQIAGDFGFVVIDASGQISFKGEGTNVGGTLSAVVDALNKTPPYRTHPREAVKVRAQLAEIRRLIAAGDYRRAYKLSRDALGPCVVGDKLTTEVFEVLDLLEAIGYARLDQVQPAVEKHDYQEAARLVRSVRREMPVTAAGKDAKHLYEHLQSKYDGFRDAAVGHRSSDDAAKLFKQARESIRGHRYGEAYDALDRILTDHADSDAAAYAKDMLARMKATPALWGHILDHKAKGDCENWISQAKLHLRNKEKKQAEELLLRIVKEYPDTIYETEARKLLVEL